MNKTELLTAIVQKQDKLIMLLKAPRYNEVWSAALKMEKELSDLKKQLEECEDNKTIEDRSHEIKWHGDEWDDLEDFNEPLNTPIKL